MQLFWRTLKSFSKREKLVLGLFLVMFAASLSDLLWGVSFVTPAAQTKTYSEGLVGQITHLNPVFTEFSDADADISSLLFSGLVKYDSTTGEFVEDLATMQLSEDGLTYTFTLKNDLYWSDGTELSAADLEFTFKDVIQSPDFKNPILKANFDGVHIEAPNSRTIVFTLNAPSHFFVSSLLVGILPAHVLGEVPVSELDTHEFNRQPIGNGPYLATAPYEENPDGSTSVTLAKNDYYHGLAPQIEQMRFIAYPNISDLMLNREVWHSAARIQENLLSEMDLDGLVTHRYELPQYTALFINTDSLMMDERAERQALSYAIDKDALLEAIDYKVKIDSPILELDSLAELHSFDTERSLEALETSGWVDEEVLEIRLLRRDFSLTNPVQEELQAKTVETLMTQLTEVGIVLNVEVYPLDELQTKIRERDYDVLLYGQGLGYNLDIFSYWHSSQATESGLNLSNYQNPKVDLYIEEIRKVEDEEDRRENLEALAELIAEDIPAVFLYTPSYYYLTDTGLTGVDFKKLLHPRDRFSNIEAWNYN